MRTLSIPKAIFLSLAFIASFCFPISSLYAQPTQPNDFQKGMTAYNLGNYEEALKDFNAALDDNPDSWESYEQQGYCYFHLNDQKKMMEAFNESLKLHPDNPELKDFISGLSKLLAPTPTVSSFNEEPPPPLSAGPSNPNPAAKDYAQAAKIQVQEKWGSSSWINLSGAFSFGALGDLNNAANVWNQTLAQYHDQGNASVANLGFQFDLENGLALDKTNALSFQVGFETGHGFQQYLVYSSPVTESINPQLFLFGLNYYHYFPDQNSRYIMTVGILFGEAVVDYYQDDPYETLQGPLGGNNFGFQLGLGREWRISPTVGFQMMGRFRYLSISQLENNYFVSGGGAGQAVLAVDSQGSLGLATPQDIGQGGLRYASIDYTGFSLNFSFNFYVF